MKRIIINQKSERALFEHLINESFDYLMKVEHVVNYLNNNFIQAETSVNNTNNIQPMKVAIQKYKGEYINKPLTVEMLYFKLQYEFSNILSDKEERDKLLWQIVNDWINKEVSKNSSLSNKNYGNPPNV